MKACCLETYNEGYNRGMEYKEQEIIKLLEADAIEWSPDCSLPLDKEHCQSCFEYVKLIDRIKGENK